MRKLRLTLAVLVLILSLAILAWGVWPSIHERRSLSVPPSQLSLPTPASFFLEPLQGG